MKQIIAIDIDDVIADSTEAFRHVVNNKTGAQLTAEHYRVADDYWGYYERVWQQHGLTDKVNIDELHAEMREDQSHIPLLPGAVYALGELSKKFKIILVTARTPDLEQSTKKWLRHQLIDESIEIYFVGHSIHEVSKSKGLVCQELGASWLIDDNPEHCKSATDYGVTAILFGDYGWHHNAPNSIIKCTDWPAVVEYFSEQSR